MTEISYLNSENETRYKTINDGKHSSPTVNLASKTSTKETLPDVSVSNYSTKYTRCSFPIRVGVMTTGSKGTSQMKSK
jgi:hypothetical protein